MHNYKCYIKSRILNQHVCQDSKQKLQSREWRNAYEALRYVFLSMDKSRFISRRTFFIAGYQECPKAWAAFISYLWGNLSCLDTRKEDANVETRIKYSLKIACHLQKNRKGPISLAYFKSQSEGWILRHFYVEPRLRGISISKRKLARSLEICQLWDLEHHRTLAVMPANFYRYQNISLWFPFEEFSRLFWSYDSDETSSMRVHSVTILSSLLIVLFSFSRVLKDDNHECSRVFFNSSQQPRFFFFRGCFNMKSLYQN